jgi:hypothetical protein
MGRAMPCCLYWFQESMNHALMRIPDIPKPRIVQKVIGQHLHLTDPLTMLVGNHPLLEIILMTGVPLTHLTTGTITRLPKMTSAASQGIHIILVSRGTSMAGQTMP